MRNPETLPGCRCRNSSPELAYTTTTQSGSSQNCDRLRMRPPETVRFRQRVRFVCPGRAPNHSRRRERLKAIWFRTAVAGFVRIQPFLVCGLNSHESSYALDVRELGWLISQIPEVGLFQAEALSSRTSRNCDFWS